MKATREFRFLANGCLAGLILLCLSWELWLAPLRPGGSWLALKVLPLLWIAPGIARGSVYTYRASTMLILAYFAEGVVRAYTEQDMSTRLALVEITLSIIFFISAIAFIRSGRTVKYTAPTTPR